ncbi:MAG: 2-amino-4-hydroxy-6-hydroxymethyldihydropteridine diphosphokinase [Roseiflexaceae bacterium]|nr:2-amino-4-hydroxy-6-hydroxymethyldihydropteridine diphosphokinase [Roseiflexaceae bacterium]
MIGRPISTCPTITAPRIRCSAYSSMIYIALGSNLGDRVANLRAALRALAPFVAVERVSPLYETEPAYVADQPRFVNAVLAGTSMLRPHELLGVLKQIEHALGREAGLRYGPRLIDLDILLYGDLVLATAELTIPHPRLAERPFVLVPLAALAPTLVPPGFTSSIADLSMRVSGTGDVIAQIGRL